MENLHSDIIENILLRLPGQAALQARHVCTTWRTLLRNYISHKPGYLFSHVANHNGNGRDLFYEDEYDHYDHAKINYYHSDNTLTKILHSRTSSINLMVGSCNGLVCLGKDDALLGAIPLVVCNPLTGESVFLPKYNYSGLSTTGASTLASGFGCCPSTNEYKVVTIYYYQGEDKGLVRVYTVGGGGEWRSIEYIGRCYELDRSPSGIYAYGALYWLHQSFYMVQECEIVAFDLQGEKFHSIPLPPFKDFKYCSYPLKLLGGNNNLYLVHKDPQAICIDIWVYNDHSSSSCWIKEFSIQRKDPQCFEPFAITRSNEVLVWYYDVRQFPGRRLCCYDPKTSTLNNLWDVNGAKYVRAIPHTQSIVSLNDLGETNVTSLKSIRRRVAKRKKSC